MAARQNPFRRIRLVYRRSSLLTKCVVLATLAVTTAVLLALTIGIRSAKAAEEASRSQAAALEQENGNCGKSAAFAHGAGHDRDNNKV